MKIKFTTALDKFKFVGLKVIESNILPKDGDIFKINNVELEVYTVRFLDLEMNNVEVELHIPKRYSGQPTFINKYY